MLAVADLGQFETTLVNLAVNARDAMNGEGRLVISAEPAMEIPPVRSHPARPGDYVAISVEDTGTGIPADRLQTIFEPFFTTKEVGRGTGLGLRQAFGFAKQSGGDIVVSSIIGEGSLLPSTCPARVWGLRRIRRRNRIWTPPAARGIGFSSSKTIVRWADSPPSFWRIWDMRRIGCGPPMPRSRRYRKTNSHLILSSPT